MPRVVSNWDESTKDYNKTVPFCNSAIDPGKNQRSSARPCEKWVSFKIAPNMLPRHFDPYFSTRAEKDYTSGRESLVYLLAVLLP